jgi:hypothetical protein
LRQIKAQSLQLLKISPLLHRTAGSETRATPPIGSPNAALVTLLSFPFQMKNGPMGGEAAQDRSGQRLAIRAADSQDTDVS